VEQEILIKLVGKIRSHLAVEEDSLIDRYIVAECPRCHTLLVADSRYKSKTCPKCNARIPVKELKVIQMAKDSRDARMIVSEAKAKRGGLDQR
jgi:DNA-directed RNA polymerase subunit RPC12/RpoP